MPSVLQSSHLVQVQSFDLRLLALLIHHERINMIFLISFSSSIFFPLNELHNWINTVCLEITCLNLFVKLKPKIQHMTKFCFSYNIWAHSYGFTCCRSFFFFLKKGRKGWLEWLSYLDITIVASYLFDLDL